MGAYLPSYIIGSKNTTYDIESEIKDILMSDTNNSNNDSTFYFSLYPENDSIYPDSLKSLSSQNLSIKDEDNRAMNSNSTTESPVPGKESLGDRNNHLYSDILSSYKTANSEKSPMSVSSFSDSEFSPWNTEYDL